MHVLELDEERLPHNIFKEGSRGGIEGKRKNKCEKGRARFDETILSTHIQALPYCRLKLVKTCRQQWVEMRSGTPDVGASSAGILYICSKPIVDDQRRK